MALEYFLYRTDFNNTLIDRSDNAFTLGTNEGQIQIDYLIPENQALYLYRESGGTIVENTETNIDNYFDFSNPFLDDTPVPFDFFTGYTATTNTTIEDIQNNISTGGTINARALFVGKSTNQLLPNTGTVLGSWDSPIQNDTIFSFNTTSGELIFNESGIYSIVFYMTVEVASGTDRSEAISFIEEDTGSGYQTIPYTTAYYYNRTSDEGSTNASIKIFREFNVGDKIRVRARKNLGSSSLEAVGDTIGFGVLREERGLNTTIFTGTTDDFIEKSTFAGFTATTITRIDNQSKYDIKSGVFTGLTLSINSSDNTTFDLSGGQGQFVDFTDPQNPIVTPFNYSGSVGNTVNNISGSPITFITLDTNLNIQQKTSAFTNADRRNSIIIGTVVHIDRSTINDTVTRPDIVFNGGDRLADFSDLFPIIKDSEGGNLIVPSANTLSFTKTSGRLYRRSANYNIDPNLPDFKFIPEASPASFFYGKATDSTIDGITRTEIVTDEYEDPNTGNIVTITGNSNQVTVQRIFLFVNGLITIARGQKVYANINDALENAFADEKDLVTSQIVQSQGLLIGEFAVRVGAVNLANTRDAVFFKIDRFGLNLNGSLRKEKGQFQIVKEIGDFPPPTTANTINLQSNFIYQINGIVDIGNNKLIANENTVIQGDDASKDGIIASRSDWYIESINNSVTLKDLTLINLDASGEVLNLIGGSSTNGFGNNIIIDRLYMQGTRFGLIADASVIVIENCALFGCYEGIRVSGTTGSINNVKVKIDNTLIEQPRSGFTGIRIYRSTYRKINIVNNFFFLSGGTTGLNIPDNLDVVSGILNNNEFIEFPSGGTKLTGGVTKKERQWRFDINSGLQDSAKIGFLQFINNATNTTITNTTSFFKVAGTNDALQLERFVSGTTDNRLVYSGGSITPFINANILLTGDLSSDQNNQTIIVAIFFNGTTQIFKREVRTGSAGTPNSFSVSGLFDMRNGDYLEVFVRNTTQARNVLIRNMEFKILGQ